ncbi:hypothetical protein PFISCL1PPCAC_7321, partial [Pristionchus fissidentatus]
GISCSELEFRSRLQGMSMEMNSRNIALENGHGNTTNTSNNRGNRAKVLNDHNIYRARHHANPLQLSTALNNSAQAFAEQLAMNDGGLSHSGSGYGENLDCGYQVSNVTAEWYSEVASYNFGYGGYSQSTGHFTAIVWRSTTSLGVGIAQSASGKQFIVAHYYPAG